MKVKIIIEETISQEFELEVDNIDDIYAEAQTKYLNGEICVDDPHLIQTNCGVIDEDGCVDDWIVIA